MCASVARHSALWFERRDRRIFRAMKWKSDQFEAYAERMRRSSREIVIAAVLTVAACAFLLAALVGNAVRTEKVGSVASERTIIK
jgi:hypothetical protein